MAEHWKRKLEKQTRPDVGDAQPRAGSTDPGRGRECADLERQAGLQACRMRRLWGAGMCRAGRMCRLEAGSMQTRSGTCRPAGSNVQTSIGQHESTKGLILGRRQDEHSSLF